MRHKLARHYGGFHPSLRGVVADPADLEGLNLAQAEVDPRKEPWYPKMKNQLALGACTAGATSKLFEYDHGRDTKKRMNPLSRLFIYYMERQIEGSLGQGDTGAYGSDAFIAASTTGICSETDWPYHIGTFQTPPTTKMMADAKKNYLLKKATKVVPQTGVAIKKVLGNNQMIAFGFTVYDSFENQSRWFESTGDDPNIMPIPKPGEQVLGGHEIVQVGFLEKYPAHILCSNDWGEEWQKDGHFLFPIKLLENKRMCSDFRTIVRPL